MHPCSVEPPPGQQSILFDSSISLLHPTDGGGRVGTTPTTYYQFKKSSTFTCLDLSYAIDKKQNFCYTAKPYFIIKKVIKNIVL